MALTMTQAAVTSTAAALPSIPLGATVTFLASATVNIGNTGSVTTSTGFALPANVPLPLALTDYLGQSPSVLYAVTATTATLSIAVSS